MHKTVTFVSGLGLSLALGVGALALGGCGGPDEGARDAAAQAQAAADKLAGELAKTRDAANSNTARLRDLDREMGRLREQLTAANTRIDQLETSGVRAADGDLPAAAPEPMSPEEAAAAKAKRLSDLQALQKKVFSGKATAEEQQRFWETARTTGIVEDLMKELEGRVEESPYDSDGRMQLAQAYIAKLLSIPGGPEQGVWAMKAEGQWKEVLKQDENHWDARYSLAFSWSQYPEFLNKTPDAIKEFEKVREVQERATPEAKHGQTYLQLSMLYRRQGNTKKAREVLQTGAERHPDDEGLRKALASMGEGSE